MQVKHNPQSGENARANFTRRNLIKSLTAGAALAIANQLPAQANTVDDLDWLIAEFYRLESGLNDHDEQILVFLDSPNRPDFSAVEMRDIDPTAIYAHKAFWFEHDVEQYFRPYDLCIFGSKKSRERHMRNKEAAIAAIRRQISHRQAWDDQVGLPAMHEKSDRLFEVLITARERIWMFPCTNFSMVARKIAFIRKDLDGDTFDGELATKILLSTVANDSRMHAQQRISM